MSQASSTSLSLVHHFASLTDPRVKRCRRHKLADIVAIAICGVVCGCKSWKAVAFYARTKADWLQTFLELPNGTPSKDTFRRVFARIRPDAFQRCFGSWTQALADTLGVKHIAIDGKTARRSHDRGVGKSALHLVSAWATTRENDGEGLFSRERLDLTRRNPTPLVRARPVAEDALGGD